jgi:hypothetical protein
VAATTERRQRRRNCSPERRQAAVEEVVAVEGSRVWKPNSPPRPLLIRGCRRVFRASELVLRPDREFRLRSGRLSVCHRIFLVSARFTGSVRVALTNKQRRSKGHRLCPRSTSPHCCRVLGVFTPGKHSPVTGVKSGSCLCKQSDEQLRRRGRNPSITTLLTWGLALFACKKNNFLSLKYGLGFLFISF